MSWPKSIHVPEQSLDPPAPTPEEEARNERNEARQEAIERLNTAIYALEALPNPWFWENDIIYLHQIKAQIEAEMEETD